MSIIFSKEFWAVKFYELRVNVTNIDSPSHSLFSSFHRVCGQHPWGNLKSHNQNIKENKKYAIYIIYTIFVLFERYILRKGSQFKYYKLRSKIRYNLIVLKPKFILHWHPLVILPLATLLISGEIKANNNWKKWLNLTHPFSLKGQFLWYHS